MPRQYTPGRTDIEGSAIELPVPTPESRLFRYKATDDILRLLVDNPTDRFTLRELGRLTDNAAQSVKRAVDVLEANGLVTVEQDGNRRRVGITRTRLSNPEDPVLRVPQPEFHPPVRAALDRLREEFESLSGVLLFGSVARGEADRQSDIDLWVLTPDRVDQHRANELATDLGEERLGGDRYEFQILVETPETARARADDLVDIFTDAITLVDSDRLRDLRHEVLTDGGRP